MTVWMLFTNGIWIRIINYLGYKIYETHLPQFGYDVIHALDLIYDIKFHAFTRFKKIKNTQLQYFGRSLSKDTGQCVSIIIRMV